MSSCAVWVPNRLSTVTPSKLACSRSPVAPLTLSPTLSEASSKTTLAVLREGGAHASIADESVTEHDGHYIWVRPDGAETARLVELAREGNLTVEIAGVFSLEQVADAFRASMSGRIRGKLIVVP